MRSLITGAAGFVGGHLRTHLEASGDEVIGVDREYDVTDASSMRDLFSDVRPDIVYHLAALTHVGDSWTQREEFTRVNVVGTQRVLDAAYDAAPMTTTIVVSSSEVYGIVSEQDQPLRETFRVAPTNPYSSSKVEAERVAHEASRRGQQVIVVRPFNHIGPGQSPSFVVPALVARLLDARDAGETSIRVGDLSIRRDFTDARDVVRAYRLLAQLGVAGEVYNVASGHDVAIDEIARELVARIAPGTQLVIDESLRRPVEVTVSRGSNDKLRAATGWSPLIALRQSLEDVIDDLVTQRASR
jgi:GDP-4-dehydro-6-deoxy-D-mannose reductase